MDLSTRLTSYAARAERGIDSLLPPADTLPSRLHEAMRYSIQSGGKRLRPALVLSSAELFDPHGAAGDPLPAAVAAECIHTYSLIHDDLPCMDNDDLRRGRPTCHRAFDEATALLAGDALLTHAFVLLSQNYASKGGLGLALARDLAEAAGSKQLIGGQMLDLLNERSSAVDAAILGEIHARKTAAMIRVCLTMGAMIGGAPQGAIETLGRAGTHLGMAFQTLDDILDVTSDAATLGKTPGKDAKAGKATFVTLYGMEGAWKFARGHSDAAIELFASLPGDTSFLVELTRFLSTRCK